MRVNVDDIAFMDRRFKLLGGRLGMPWQEALGRCLPVWALAYARRTAILPAGDIDALAERPGFADAMVSVELASDESSGDVYLCGVNDRIDFLLMQDAKREKAREARLAAAGVESPRGPSRGKKSSPRGPSRGAVPGTGSYSPDPSPDPSPEKISLPRAIPPSTEPAAVPTALPAANRPVGDRPDVETRRQAIRAIMAELGETRSRVAAELGVIAQPLLAFDPGERDLGDRLALASSADEHAAIVASARHVIAMAALEAQRDRSVEWLHGVLFGERNWRRLAGMTAADASRPRAGPRGSAARAEQKTIRATTPDDDTPPIPSWSKR